MIELCLSVFLPQVVESYQAETLSTKLLRPAILGSLESLQGFAEILLGLSDIPKIPLENAHANKAFPLVSVELIPAR
jgi:hypothetical protein